MKREFFHQFLFSKSGTASLVAGCALCIAHGVRADQIQMQNGDQYFGRVLSLSSDTLTLQSEVLGTIKLPRSRIGAINFGVNAPVVAEGQTATNRVAIGKPAIAKPAAATNTAPELADTLR